MNKRTSSILVSLFLLFISIGLLLVYFVFKDKNNDKVSPLSLFANDQILYVGEDVYNFYSVSDKNALIEFDVSKQNIISVNKDKISGISAGEVYLTITATLNRETTKTQLKVTVLNHDYTINIMPEMSCYFQNNTLFINADVCQFQLNVFDRLNNKIDNLNYLIQTTNDAAIERNFLSFQLYSTQNCQVIFIFEDIDFQVTINVVRI